eukprot:COSAG03_NODE_747_length_6008_cov_4.262989_3_plen_79_part_00
MEGLPVGTDSLLEIVHEAEPTEMPLVIKNAFYMLGESLRIYINHPDSLKGEVYHSKSTDGSSDLAAAVIIGACHDPTE